MRVCFRLFFIIGIWLILGFNQSLSAQQIKLSFLIKDSLTKEVMPGVVVELIGQNKNGLSDSKGQLYFETHPGNYTIKASYVGYKSFSKTIELTANIQVNIFLSSDVRQLNEIQVSDNSQRLLEQTMGTHQLTVKEMERLPQFLGENDPIKAIQFLPGIQKSGEGNSGFHVRGGGMDQNLILVDDVPVYNIGHLFGFFSVIDAHILDQVNVYKGSMPSNYGGRLASVVDLKTRSGNLEQYRVNGSLGLLSSTLVAEGPLKKQSSSFIFSARRTYIDAFKNILNRDSRFYQNLFFYDLNAKLFFQLNDNNRVYVSAYKGLDFFEYDDAIANKFNNDISWGNQYASLKWNSLINSKLQLNLISSITAYQMNFTASLFGYGLNLETKVNDINNKVYFVQELSSRQVLKYGFEHIFHRIAPNNFKAGMKDQSFDVLKNNLLNSQEASLFIDHDIDILSRLKINSGMRLSFFQQLGPFDRYILDEFNKKKDTLFYGKNESVSTYQNLEPRLSLNYQLNENNSLKAGYTQNYQYIHMAPTSSVSLPTDVWLPSSSIIKPQFGQQFSLGYFKSFKKPALETSVEVYYKTMKNLIEYQEGIMSVQNISLNYDQTFFFGQGKSYGTEFLIKKTIGAYQGWLAYTISRTTRTFPDIEQGRDFYAKYDRRHDLSITNSYQLNTRWYFSASFVYATGNALTLPVARYLIQGNVINTYSKRNAFRMPANHRMDISITYKPETKKRFNSEFNFSVYNVYNRKNPFYVLFETYGSAQSYSLRVNVKKVTLFAMVPSVSWKFNF